MSFQMSTVLINKYFEGSHGRINGKCFSMLCCNFYVICRLQMFCNCLKKLYEQNWACHLCQYESLRSAHSSTVSYHILTVLDQLGPAPVSTHWTVLCLDLQQILSAYLNRRYAYLKSMRLCANLSIRNVFTSDTLYQPGMMPDLSVWFYICFSHAVDICC